MHCATPGCRRSARHVIRQAGLTHLYCHTCAARRIADAPVACEITVAPA